jgi:hypothetical protein
LLKVKGEATEPDTALVIMLAADIARMIQSASDSGCGGGGGGDGAAATAAAAAALRVLKTDEYLVWWVTDLM